MGEHYLLEEIAKRTARIKRLRAEIAILQDDIDYLRELYCLPEETKGEQPYKDECDFMKKIRANGFIIGIRC